MIAHSTQKTLRVGPNGDPISPLIDGAQGGGEADRHSTTTPWGLHVTGLGSARKRQTRPGTPAPACRRQRTQGPASKSWGPTVGCRPTVGGPPIPALKLQAQPVLPREALRFPTHFSVSRGLLPAATSQPLGGGGPAHPPAAFSWTPPEDSWGRLAFPKETFLSLQMKQKSNDRK